MSFFKKKQKEIKSKIKENKFDSMDDLDFGDDDNWDLDDLDIDVVSSKRSPITRVGRGILKGIKGHALDFRNHRREVLKHFPDLVSDTIDQLEETANSLADEVRETARKSRPDLRRMSGTIDKLVPSKYGRIKKLTAKAVDRFSDESEETVSPERAREETLSNTLADIFNANQASDTYNQKRSEAQAMISEKLAEGRHKQTTFQLGKIHESVALANAFNTKVTTAFQKKLLEIQFRSYYVQSDLLATYKAQSQESKVLLAAIMKNTGLPDYVKMNESDRFKATARKELFDAAKEKFFSKNSYYKRIVEEAKNKLNSFNLGGVSGALEDLLQGQEVGMDFIEDGVAAIVSQGILPGITSKYFKKALDRYIPKGSDKHNKIIDMIIKLQNPSKRGQEIADILEDWEYDPSLLKSLLGKGAAPLVDVLRRAADAGAPKVDLRKSDEDLLAAAEFNKISQISLVKIIPGYLSRILQQSERIGNIESLIYAQREPVNSNKVKDTLRSTIPELLKYDANDGEFLSESKMNEKVSKLVDKHIDIEGRTNKLFEMSKMTLEGKDFITEKSNFKEEAKSQVKIMLRDLGEAKKAASGIKDTQTRTDVKHRIDLVREDIKAFKDEYMNSSVSNYKFDYNGFMSLVTDAKYAIEEVHNALKESSTLGSLVSKTQSRESTMNTMRNKIEARDKKIDADQVRVLSQVFHIADAEGKGIEELPSLLKNKTFRDQVMMKYSIPEKDLNKARSILNSSDFKNNREVLASLVSEFNSYREGNKSATQLVNRQMEVGNIDRKNLHKFGMEVSDDRSSMKDNQATVIRKIVLKAKNMAKQSDLKFWQNEINAQITSPETKRKFNLLINAMGPGDRLKIMQFLHERGSGDIAKVENMINDMTVKYEDYNRRDKPGDIFTHLTSESEIGDPNGTVTSDPALKLKKGSMNKGVMGSWTPTADKLGQVKTDYKYTYKFDKDQKPYVGPMADELQKQFGNAVAPGGKKINIGSMMGVLGTSINELSYKMKNDTASIANAIAYQTSQNSSWLVSDLAAKGVSGDIIKKIFSKDASSVEKVVDLTEKGILKGAEVKAKIQEKVDEITEKVVDAKAKLSDKRRAAQEYIRGKYRAGLTYAGIQSGKLDDVKDAAVAKVHKANDYMGRISTAISANETLKGTFVDSAAKRLAEDMNEVVNAPDGETRAKALSDMFVTLISSGVEKVGEGGRFAYAKTVGKFVKKSVAVYNQYKSVHCMSDVYLGKTESDLETPVLESINYRTTDTSRMYFDSKTGTRITSACHVRGAVSHANGDVIFTDEDIKEHGLYVLDNEGHPVKLGGIKFMASTAMNAAARLAKFAVKKIWNNKATNKIKDIVKKKSKWLVDSRLGRGVRGSFLGRRTGDVRDIAHATYRTLLGDNQLLPTLTDKIERLRNHHFNRPGKGVFGKYGAMAYDAMTGTFDESPDYYEPTGILRRKHESDMINAQRHFENITSKIDDPIKAEKHYNKYVNSMKSLNKRKMPEEEKKRLAHLLHMKYFGHENPDIGPVDYNKLAYESATGKTRHKLSFRHPFRSAGRLGGMALRHPLRAGLIGMGGLALAPAILPMAATAGAGYLGYRAIKHDVSGGGVGRRFARWKKPWTIPGAMASSVLHPFKHPGNGDTYNPSHLPFDDTVINGDERVRRGGIRDMLSKMKQKGKHPKDKFVNIIKNHKGAAMGAGMLGLGLLGSIGDIIGKSYDVLKGVWDTLKIIKGATKMLFKLPELLGKLGGFLKRGIGKLGDLFRGGKGAIKDTAEDAEKTAGEDAGETVATDAAEAGGEDAAIGAAGAEAGATTLGAGAALGGVAVAGAAGYGVGTLLNKYVLNKYVPGWKNGKDVYSLFNRSTAHVDMINSLKMYTSTINSMMVSIKNKKSTMTLAKFNQPVFKSLLNGNALTYAIKHSANPAAAAYLKARSNLLELLAKSTKDDAVHAKKVANAIAQHKPIPTAPGAKKKVTTPDNLPAPKTKLASPPVLSAYAVKKEGYDKSMDKDLSTWTILFKRYVSIFKKDPVSGLKFFHAVPTQKALYGPLYEFAKKHSSAASLSYLDARLEFLKAGATTSSKNKLKLNKKAVASVTTAAKAKLDNKKKGSGNIFTNMFNDIFGPSNPKGSLAAVKYAGQASQYGVPGSNPLGVSYKGNSPQVNLTMAKNMRKSKAKIISEIKSVCSKHGFDSGYLLYVTAMESGLNPNAKNPYATASGLYQYIDSTWAGKMKQYAAQYKIPYNASPFDIKYSTIIAGASANSDASYLSSMKPEVYYIDLYMIHFLGQGGATTFFKYLKDSPNTSGVEVFGNQDASENQPYFYNNNSPLSIKGMYEKIASLMTYRSKQFGLHYQSFDVYGGHGKVGKQKKAIAAQTKTKAAAAIHKGLGKKIPKGGPAKPATPGKAMTVATPAKKAPAPTAVAKKHVSTPTLVDTSAAHQAFNKRHANKAVTETATVANNHLSDISEHNKEMKMILKQQLTVQTQTLAYLKNISQVMVKTANSNKVSSNAPLPPIKTEPVYKPHAPKPAVHVGPRTDSLKAANAVLS